jgi:hypothetical protein
VSLFKDEATCHRLDRVIVHNQDRWHRSVSSPFAVKSMRKDEGMEQTVALSQCKNKTLSSKSGVYPIRRSVVNDTPLVLNCNLLFPSVEA